MGRGSCRRAAGDVGNTLARVLELPRGRNFSARTSRIGRGSARDPAAHERFEVGEQLICVMRVRPEGKGGHMPGDNRDVLEVLKSELYFLEHGWYKSSPR